MDNSLLFTGRTATHTLLQTSKNILIYPPPQQLFEIQIQRQGPKTNTQTMTRTKTQKMAQTKTMAKTFTQTETKTQRK